ncbi:MAG TPA: discoidin domain-containing protein [Pyrinomonadaceae bacterium]|nr:discoidin domain-containing protein [Pyrinomonadaceae bacterium]
MNFLPLLQCARQFLRSLARRFYIVLCIAISIQPLTVIGQHTNQRSRSAVVTVSVTPGHPANRFAPSQALGAGIDGHDKGVADLQLTAPNIQAMLSAGFKSLTYRLRTELAGDAWHWNPHGSWSDANDRRGYWISDSEPGVPISLSYGYRLPRRGNTIDQANDEGYSRLDDGDRESFWKSNPYLDRRFTGESSSLHPQWIVIEFKKPEAINAVRILWGQPFAEAFRIQYGNFDDVSDIALSPAGTWRDFPRGMVAGSADVSSANGRNSDDLIRVSQKPIRTRWLRILMTESSQTNSAAKSDVRDRLGFAVRELYAGFIDTKSAFHDRIRHAANRWKQTVIHVSSTDPWHRETDLDESVEQPGFDRTFHSGLTHDLPVLLPTGLAYDTPENAANEIRYLRGRGYSFDKVELGEEPDGQYITPEDFGALYLQWATAIHRIDPHLKLGGPSFQEIMPDDEGRPVRLGNSEWMRRFLDYLKRRGRLSDYSFFSFEWYPFDDVCAPVAPQLASAPKLLENALREMERRGLSGQIPWIISEYGYSAFATRAEIGIEGALLNADIVGKFLTLGGDQVFLFGYTPGIVGRDFPCTAGGNMLFSMDDDGDIMHYFATYFGARLVTQEWLQPTNEVHEIYPATTNARNSKGEELVTAYAVHRPDGLWSVLLINKDPQRSFETNVVFHKTTSGPSIGFDGRLDVYQYSDRQYLLGGPARNPYPLRADEPEHRVIEPSRLRPAPIALPPYSLTVIRGRTSPI